MKSQLSVHHIKSLPLKYHSTCGLLGISPDLVIYAEEIYGESDWTAQHAIRMDGVILESADELYGHHARFSPLSLPTNSLRPHAGLHTQSLNFAGPRHRGKREDERVQEMVRPLSIQTKMALVERLNLDIFPPLILGLAESYVISEAEIQADLYVVCRRIRIAYALAHDPDRSYDYDTIEFHAAHIFDPETQDELSVGEVFDGLPGVQLHNPTDCIVAHDHLFIADGGGNLRANQIHIWRIEHRM